MLQNKNCVEKYAVFVYSVYYCVLSSVVERSIHIRKVAGSIPAGRTVYLIAAKNYFFCHETNKE